MGARVFYRVGVRFADFISVFLKYPMKMKYFGLIGYLRKKGSTTILLPERAARSDYALHV